MYNMQYTPTEFIESMSNAQIVCESDLDLEVGRVSKHRFSCIPSPPPRKGNSLLEGSFSVLSATCNCNVGKTCGSCWTVSATTFD